MIDQVSQCLLHSSARARIFAFSLIVTLLVFLVFVFVTQFFKPSGKRNLQDGRTSRLPPGPRGFPILGNLLSLREGRHDPDHAFVSVVCLRINIAEHETSSGTLPASEK